MPRGIVVAVDASRRLFVLQIADGSSAVYSQHSGAPVEVGNLLMGYTGITGFRIFAHCQGFCRAHYEAGPLDNDALRLALSAWAMAAPLPIAGIEAHATTAGTTPVATEGNHVH